MSAAPASLYFGREAACVAHRSSLLSGYALDERADLAVVTTPGYRESRSERSERRRESLGWLDRATWQSLNPRLLMVTHPPGCSSNSSAQQFETRHLALAAFLIAGRYLKYAGLRAENGRGVFLFHDPDGRAPQLQNEFDSGAECSAVLFHATLKRLRREIDAAVAQQGGAR